MAFRSLRVGACAGAVSLPKKGWGLGLGSGVGRCPRRRAPTRGSVLVARSLSGPVAARRQSGFLPKKGTFVLLAGFRVVAAQLPSGFPPKRGAFVTAGWPPWLLPGSFGVSTEVGAFGLLAGRLERAA